jgi:hypothetical protein
LRAASVHSWPKPREEPVINHTFCAIAGIVLSSSYERHSCMMRRNSPLTPSSRLPQNSSSWVVSSSARRLSKSGRSPLLQLSLGECEKAQPILTSVISSLSLCVSLHVRVRSKSRGEICLHSALKELSFLPRFRVKIGQKPY